MRPGFKTPLYRCAAFIFLGCFPAFSSFALAEEVGNPEGLFKTSTPPIRAAQPLPDSGATSPPPDIAPTDAVRKDGAKGKNKLENFLTDLGEKIDRKTKPLGENIEGKFSKTIRPLEKTIVYSGYCEDFVPIKKRLYEGKADEVALEYASQDMKAAEGCASMSEIGNKLGYLGLLERGTLAIDTGDVAKSVERFTAAEEILSERRKKSKLSEFWTKAGEVFDQTVSGDQEKGTYWGEGYERVLMLNYKTIAFLLAGDRGAYNVTRRAIDWQRMEKEAFEERIKEAAKTPSDSQPQNPDPAPGREIKQQDVDFSDFLASQFGEPEARVKALKSAYVNPFGYYMAGVIQEFEGYNDRSLRDNARIAYEKALELYPDSPTLKSAVEDLKSSHSPAGKKLLHVIVGDGFSPEKKVLVSGYAIGGKSFPLKLPYFERVPTRVARIELQAPQGRVLGEISTVADVEAICLRHQMDMLPIYNHQISLAFLKDAPKALFGRKSPPATEGGAEEIKKLRELDTRAWMSLPSAIKAGRFFLDRNLSEVRLVAFDEKGNTLSNAMVRLESDSHTFVYARSIDHMMYAYASKPLWIGKQPI